MKRLLICLLAVVPMIAGAHEWYDGYCCNDNDCTAIPRSTVQIVAEGYLVTLDPSTHFMARGPITQLFRWDDVRMSQDQDYHACVVPSDMGRIRCFYAPMLGA